MGDSIFAAVVVLCCAITGGLLFGAGFAIVSASMLEPSVQRAVLFGLTFGASAGAVIGAIFIEPESGRTFAGKLPHRALALLFVAFAVNGLFNEGAWNAMFEGSQGLALASVVMWSGITTWLTMELPATRTLTR